MPHLSGPRHTQPLLSLVQQLVEVCVSGVGIAIVGVMAWWISGRHGTLSPWSQAQAFALSRVSEKRALNLTDPEIAEEVFMIGGGHPSRESIRKLRDKFASDPQWYPGKEQGGASAAGRPKVISGSQQHAIAKCAMHLKAKGLEPSVSSVMARCPKATVNPTTDQPYTSKVITAVFKTKCYDTTPDMPWQHLQPLQKTALSPELKEARLVWAGVMLDKQHTAKWYFDNSIWVDPCTSSIPGFPKTAFGHKQATYGRAKRWMSANSRGQSRNMRASPYAGKQTQWFDRKVWWSIVLCRGNVHIEAMPQGWTQTGEGQAYMFALLPGILQSLLGDVEPLPSVLFTDRGPGFYHPSTGNICPEYLEALHDHGFQPWAGERSKWQPPDIADVLLHETVASWIRYYMKQHPLKLGQNTDNNEARLCKQLQGVVDHINSHHAVSRLCQDLPKWQQGLFDSGGDRLTR